jgi:hypothetical protein
MVDFFFLFFMNKLFIQKHKENNSHSRRFITPNSNLENKIHYHTNQATYYPHIAQSQQKGKSLTNIRTNNETMKHRKKNFVIHSLPTLSTECPNFHKAQHSLSCN